MIKYTSCLLLMYILLLPALAVRGQDVSLLMKEAEQLETSLRDNEALKKYLQVLALQPNNINALCKASELSNIIGRRQPTREKQRDYYNTALEYAKRAIKINPRHSEANFAMALAMGRLAQTAGGEKRIDAVREIKTFAERSIQYDPENFKGYHVLGKWHLEVSSLNSIEKWLVKVTYGGLPPASVDDAIRFYEKSKQLNPAFLLNYLELAKAFKEKDEVQKSIGLLQTMMSLPSVTTDDNRIKNEGRKLLNELK